MASNDPKDSKGSASAISQPTDVQALSANKTFTANGSVTGGTLKRMWAKVFSGVLSNEELPKHPWDLNDGESPATEGEVSGNNWTIPNLSGATGSCAIQTFVAWYAVTSKPIAPDPKNFRSHMPGSTCPEIQTGLSRGTTPVPRYYRLAVPGDVEWPGSQALSGLGLIKRTDVVLEFSELSVDPFGRIWKCKTDSVMWVLSVSEGKPGQKATAALFCQPIGQTLAMPFVWSGKNWEPMGVNKMVGQATDFGRAGEFPLEVVRAD